MGNWNPGNRDAEAFFTADENGFFMAKTAGGDPVASISAVRYGEDYGFIGLNISNPGQPYNGYGKYTLKYAMHHLDGRIIGTDAMTTRLSLSIRLGFAIAHKTVGVGGVIVPEALSPASFPKGGADDHVVIKDLTQVRKDAIMLYDREHVPAERYRFLRSWLTTPGHVVRVGTVGNEIRGYGVLRPCFEGSRIGPLFAESADVANMLIRALVAGLSPGTKVFLEIPEPNQKSIGLVKQLGLSEMWETFRIYRGPAPNLPLDRIYAVTCLQLG